MKSRTSFFNPTAFKKDVTRFAPAWVLYSVGLFMILAVTILDRVDAYRAESLSRSLVFMVFINLGYGLLAGQLLFGDLFNPRHCNALHAMPLTRDCWFYTHVIAGLAFSLVPNLVMSLIAMAMLGSGWQVALWWLAANALQYLFFFGLAVCAALCVGSRFAMLLVYGIVNFFSIIVYWFYYAIYEPLLYGVSLTADPFTLFCPVWTMVQNSGLIDVVQAELTFDVVAVNPGAGWGYLGICAGIGVLLIGVARVLYNSRKLECAGDFMAVRALEPVFLTLYTLCAAAGFQIFAELFGTNAYIFLALGFTVGYFTGRMLLMRTIRVFQPKGFVGFAVLAAVFVASMVLTRLDPLSIVTRIPDTDDVVEVYVSNDAYYSPADPQTPALDSVADIDAARELHRLALEAHIDDRSDYDGRILWVNLHYVLESGAAVKREYAIAADSPAGQILQEFMSRPAYVLGAEDVDTALARVDYLYLSCDTPEGYMENQLDRHSVHVRGILDAVYADCLTGAMAQDWAFHEGEESVGWLEFRIEEQPGYWNYYSINIYDSAVNTTAYLHQHAAELGFAG